MIAAMKWIREHAGPLLSVVGLVVALWAVFTMYGTLAKTDDVEALERALESALLELAECVDNPQYVESSDRARRDPNCEIRVHREFRQDEDEERGQMSSRTGTSSRVSGTRGTNDQR